VTNAGFFNTTSTDCYGNLISQGRVVRVSDSHVTNFGMRNGSFVIGYLTPEEVTSQENPFQVLGRGGVLREKVLSSG
jgi:hypothetical protein